MLLDGGMGRIGEQVVEFAFETGQFADHREIDALDERRTRGVEVDDEDRLAVRALAEGVRQRRSRVPDRLAHRLRGVQVTQRDVVGTVERRRGHRFDSADGDGPLGVAGLATDDEGVGQDDGAAVATRGIGAHAFHRRVEDLLVRAGLGDASSARVISGSRYGMP